MLRADKVKAFRDDAHVVHPQVDQRLLCVLTLFDGQLT